MKKQTKNEIGAAGKAEVGTAEGAPRVRATVKQAGDDMVSKAKSGEVNVFALLYAGRIAAIDTTKEFARPDALFRRAKSEAIQALKVLLEAE